MDVVALEKTEEYQGRYRVERTLGAGGMGVVYLAEDIKLGRKVAIKQLRSDMTGNSAEARFRSEAQLLARLNHPNIVRLYDVIEKDHSIALVMELVEGVTLKEWMRENSPTLAEKLDLLMQICQGLSKAHCLGIIHRDLKPENILVTTDGTAKISDFGIAKALDCDQDLTREDHIAGSVQAMSPEQLQGAKLDARSDLFSLGAIAYELLCDSKPFERGDKSALAFAQQITQSPHVPPQQSWPDIPKPLAALLDRLLGKRPQQRPESAQQVYEALDLVYKHGIDASTRQYSETVTQLLIKPKQKRGLATFFFLALAISCAAVVWGWKAFTQLPPQYIAVLPVEINGSISGGADEKMLVEAMVRQGLQSTPAQLKSSALVSYTPSKDTSHEEQLQILHNKGVTDALLANVNCIQLRCSIELQRINPADSQIRDQTSFLFLSDKRQQAEYTIGNNAVELFAQSYRRESHKESKMEPEDYNSYLAVLAKLDSENNVGNGDLEILEQLIGKYPTNTNLYTSYTSTAMAIWGATSDNKLLSRALGILTSADGFGVDKTAILEAKFAVKSVSDDRQGFLVILKKLEAEDHPSAHLLTQFTRYQYMQGNYEQSLEYAKEAAALNPSFNNEYYVAVNTLQLGRYDAAREILQSMVETYPGRWKAYNLLSVIELEKGNLKVAEELIGKVPVGSRDWSTRSNLGTIFFLQKRYTEALAEYQSILAEYSDNIQMNIQVAECYIMLSDRETAKKYFSKVIDLTETNTDITSRRYRAQALANVGRIAESIALIKELIHISPESTYINKTAANIYALAEEWQSANYHLEELLNQGMSINFLFLPEYQTLCTQPHVSKGVQKAICN
ncbi:hypothetical protein BTJ40_18925 [Microbulbifer sp. A4B17]|uniref:serine/threonine-protein kinase n=1 Tax=Microbulbifer sp. A4B17 TaxID=359370 RepID=UPI000D52BEBD|nr:serine/threonine-protein kinase [Microbulbifer sp. A4B17]AWF82717.1 hypothetical protein BTJ40_18925 [Microbulbifer sp. A4B17]